MEVKKLVGFALLGGLILLNASLAAAQGRRSTPGRPSGSVRPDLTMKDEAEQKKSTPRRSVALSDQEIDRRFNKYPGIAQALNTTEDALKSEYREELASNPDLVPEQLFVAKLLVVASRGVRSDLDTTKKTILEGWKNRIHPKQVLRSRGFTSGEADEAFKRASRMLAEAKNRPS